MNDTTYEPMADQAIRLHRFCKEYRVLPSPGGILDQDYLHMFLLETVSEAMAEYERREQSKNNPRNQSMRGRRR